VIYFKSPKTLQERVNFTSAEDTPRWNRFLVNYVGLLGPMSTFVVAGLDYRYGWSVSVPFWIQIVSALVVIGGYMFAGWAMIVNPYFSFIARIQKERGQTVVKRGPYQFVRHPGYAGAMVAALLFPLMLSNMWAYIPATALAGFILLRTSP
jgi:protein-S-isoprenylcysteine O-methyltransferase Ste14